MPTQTDRLLAAIGYLGVLCILPLVLERKNLFVQHHGKQGLVLLFAWVILWIGNIVPFLGQIIWLIGSIALVILMVMGILNAFSGKMWEMPYLGVYAKRLKF